MSKTKKRVEKDKKRYELPIHPKPMQEFVPARVPAVEAGLCENAYAKLNEALARARAPSAKL